MKNRFFWIFVLSILLISFFAYCQLQTNKQQMLPVPLEHTMELGVTTLGNMTYISMNQAGLLSNNIGYVFKAIQQWEESNPDREIVDIDYIWDQSMGNIITENVYGIIIRSVPKE